MQTLSQSISKVDDPIVLFADNFGTKVTYLITKKINRLFIRLPRSLKKIQNSDDDIMTVLSSDKASKHFQ